MSAPHGTVARYRAKPVGCRCPRCCAAYSAYAANRTRRIGYGTWHPFVAVDRAQQHVRALVEAGMSINRIAELADVDRILTGAIHSGNGNRHTGPVMRIRAETERKLLSVRFDPAHISAARPVDAVGTQRRIQALVCRGWPMAQLAVRLGKAAPNLRFWLRQRNVSVGTAKAVRALYGALWDADPVEHGVTPRAALMARNLASKNGWPPSGAWDDDTIDDPMALPEWTGACGTVRGYHIHRRERIPTCAPCGDAYAAYAREAKQQKAARELQEAS